MVNLADYTISLFIGDENGNINNFANDIPADTVKQFDSCDLNEDDLGEIAEKSPFTDENLTEITSCFQEWAEKIQNVATRKDLPHFWFLLKQNGIDFKKLTLLLYSHVRTNDEVRI